MTTWDRANAFVMPTLAYLTAGAERPDFDALDLDELDYLEGRLALTSGRSVVRLEDSDGRTDFALLDKIPPAFEGDFDELQITQAMKDIEAALERWAAKEDGDEEEAER